MSMESLPVYIEQIMIRGYNILSKAESLFQELNSLSFLTMVLIFRMDIFPNPITFFSTSYTFVSMVSNFIL